MRSQAAYWNPLALSRLLLCGFAFGMLSIVPRLLAEAPPPAAEKGSPPAESPAAESEKPAEAPPAEPPAEKTSAEAIPDEDDQLLPELETMPVPTVDELFKEPVDWIVVTQRDIERALAVKLISPRPDTIAKMQAAIEASKKWPRPEKEEDQYKQREEKENLNWLTVHLPGEDEAEYQLPLKLIQRIIYHEDLVLKRAAIFMDEGKLRDAFELLYTLERRLPNWPQLAETKNRLIFLEAEAAFARNETESALAYLEELHSRNAGYPQLRSKLGQVADRLMSDARKADDFRQARHFLYRLERCEPRHDVAKQWRDSLISESRGFMEKAQEQAGSGAHDEATTSIDRSARIWPALPGLAEAHRRHANRFQRLNVGVIRHSGESTPYFLPTAADERELKLTRFRIFEVDSIDDATHYRTPLFESWTPIDLGRRVVFSLRPNRAIWESKPLVTAGTIVSDLSDRIDPRSPRHDERLSHFIDSLTVRSPFEFEVRFTRVPVRTEPLFRLSIEATSTAASSHKEPQSVPPREILTRRFERQSRNDGLVSYRRTIPQPDQLAEYNVAEIVEQRYDTHERALQGLIRGDVSVLTELRPWQLKQIQDDDRFFVLPYAVPTTHVLQFNPQSKAGRSRELRSAIAFSVDRERLLKGIVLRDEAANAESYLTSAPFSRKSPAYNPLVVQRKSDLTVALALSLAAKKQFQGEIPTLKMACVPDPIAVEVCRQMIAQWKRIGLNVELVTEPNEKGVQWDIVYRTVRMEEPLVEWWQFIALDRAPSIEAIAHLPDWLRRELIELENAGDWNTAVTLLRDLHRDLYAEIEYVPLWELDDYFVGRKNIRGFASSPLHPYQNVERWVVQSWYPTDAPEPTRPAAAGAKQASAGAAP
ncbi:MAG: ABC transporter substrate-binding protein [Planctomycetaceae bacterium]